MPSEQAIIRIQNLCTRFGDVVVHQDLNLEIFAGDLVALVGGSGAGKTTLLRQMLGLERPASGTVCVLGEDVHKADAQQLQGLRNRWGMLFQHGALFSSLSAFDNVAQPLRELRALPEELIRESALLKLYMVGISAADSAKMPAELSGGMIKRVALARALALEPELLFLDEPTAGLDPNLSESFVELIQSLRKEMPLTLVMVTHDLDTLFSLSTRIAVLADKKVIALDTPENVVKLAHPFVREFFLGARGLRAMQGMPKAAEAVERMGR